MTETIKQLRERVLDNMTPTERLEQVREALRAMAEIYDTDGDYLEIDGERARERAGSALKTHIPALMEAVGGKKCNQIEGGN